MARRVDLHPVALVLRSRDQTATEVQTQDSMGRRSFLATETGSMEELENNIWYLYSQKQFPNKPAMWRGTMIERTRDFELIDSDKWASRLAERYFGKGATVPSGEQGKIDAAKKINSLDGVNYDDTQLEAAVKSQEEGERAKDQRNVLENERLQIVNGNEANGDVQARINAIGGGGDE